MGSIIKTLVLIAALIFVASLLIGVRGKTMAKLLKIAVVILVIAGAGWYFRGTWMPNAGGGFAINPFASSPSKSIIYNDHTLDIPTGYNEDGNVATEHFNHCLEYYIANTDSAEYNPQFSHLLISFCNAIHSEELFRQGFDNLLFDTITCDYSMSELLLAYGMCKKTLSTGETIVLVVARGTGDDGWEIASNFDVSPDHYGRHSGFSDAAQVLHTKLLDFLGPIDLSKVVFVITGHSRGAAAANILSAMLIDENIRQDHLYCYTFACPDTAFLSDSQAESYKCIYNIGNVNDVVSWTPWNIWKESGSYYGFGADNHWNKYGQSYWYSTSDWNGSLEASINNLDPEHYQATYLGFLRNEEPLSYYKTRAEIH